MRVAFLLLVPALILPWVTFVPDEQHLHDPAGRLDSVSVPISRAPALQESLDEAEQYVA